MFVRAAVCAAYGGPEVVSLQEVERPTPGDDELLVRVVASTVNRTDSGVRSASPAVVRLVFGLRRPRRPILGSDFAGSVEAIGSAVRDFAPGDRVFGFDDGRFGGHGEYLTIPASAAVAIIPEGVTEAQAAASVEGAHYALTSIDRAGVGAGDHVLVYGASGAIGSAAAQLLVAREVEVTAVVATRHVELARNMGVADVVDYTVDDFTAIGRMYDLVFDAVGKTSFGACEALVREGGTFMSAELGPRLENLWLSVTTRFHGSGRVVFAFPTRARRHVQTVRDALASATFTPVIDRTYPLEEIVDAYRYVDTGEKTGNVVLTVSD